MKKRLISLMMAAVMAGSLAGCGGEQEPIQQVQS